MSSYHGMGALKGMQHYCAPGHTRVEGDRFGRLFPTAPPLFTDPRTLADLGRAGGPMDGTTGLPDTSTVPVGMVFLGQFIDHDITLDVTSTFDSVNEPTDIVNVRSPTLDLDCVYGTGPEAMPFLYHTDGAFKGVKLNTGAEVGDGDYTAYDLPRIGTTAVIGDPRNDENRVVSQIQLAFLRTHNAFVDLVHDDPGNDLEGRELFEEARRLLTWHYQWSVVHDFLRAMCGDVVIQDVLGKGRSVYCPQHPFIPVEFSVAAYRFGHSMVPMSVQLQSGDPAFALFGEVLGMGFSPVPEKRAIADMHELFETYDPRTVQSASRLDTKMAPRLLDLPTQVVGESEASLATRNLDRGQSFRLPSGEVVAELIGRDEDEIEQVTDAVLADEPGLVNGSPLWYYVLKEAEVVGRQRAQNGGDLGEGLGPVGATIVAEVIVGLIELDARSWLANDRSWRPTTVQIDGADVALDSIGNLLAWSQPELPMA